MISPRGGGESAEIIEYAPSGVDSDSATPILGDNGKLRFQNRVHIFLRDAAGRLAGRF